MNRSDINIVFMGTPQFSCPTLKALIDSGFNVTAIVTQEDKPSGRGKKLTPPKVKELALEYVEKGKNLTIYQPKKIKNNPEFIELLRGQKPHFIVVVAYGKILPAEILDLPLEFNPHGACINVHSSLLPKYRGAAPVNWALVNGEEVVGVTTMFMDIGMDTGDMLKKSSIKVEDDDNSATILDKLAPLGADLLVETLDELASGTLKGEKQDETKATHAPLMEKALGEIDFNKSAVDVFNHIRGFNPWPGAFAFYGAESGGDLKRLKIHSSKLIDDDKNDGENNKIGTVVDIESGELKVVCGDGNVITLTTVQPENKKQMNSTDFIRGYKIKNGTRFKYSK